MVRGLSYATSRHRLYQGLVTSHIDNVVVECEVLTHNATIPLWNVQENVDVSPSPDTILNSPGLANIVRVGNQSEIQVSCQCEAFELPLWPGNSAAVLIYSSMRCWRCSCESQTNTPCSSSEQFFKSNAYVAGGRTVFLFFPSIFRVPFISELESSLHSPSLIK